MRQSFNYRLNRKKTYDCIDMIVLNFDYQFVQALTTMNTMVDLEHCGISLLL